MKLVRLRAIARKEFLHVFRDRLSLAIAVALPLILIIIFGFALSFDVKHVPLVVWDQSETQLSRELISRFTGSPYFRLVDYARNYPEVERAVDSGQALLALVISRDFAAHLESGRPAAVQLIADGGDSNTATIALGYAEAVARGFSQQIAVQQVQQQRGLTLQPPIDLRPRVWFNADLESRNYIIPGLIAVIMMVIAAILTSLTIAREWERGTMEQLIATPVRGIELVLGKLIPYFVVGMFDVLLAVLMTELVFHVPLRGNILLLFGTAAVFLSGALSIGMLISILTRNQLLATQLAMVLTFLPADLLSGFLSPIENMPRAIQLVTYFVPARYFVTLLRSIYLKGVGLDVLAWEAATLLTFCSVTVVVALLCFRKKLA
ncbi:MAG TPA: ABC transporter permease [Phycisphaerae bacterium]|nr:ABC transporter permease [Phycisphaerae bacterium]